MQFKVPQFLDIEDKIFGPFTFRQFVYLAGGAGICFLFYKILGFWIGGIPILIMAGFSLALAFYRPNGKPFINMLEAGFKYLVASKLYIWENNRSNTRGEQKNKPNIQKERTTMAMGGSKLTGSKLKDLAWSLDVLDTNK